jgi:hypothetical protein
MTEANLIYVICWMPGSDLDDCSASELVRAAAGDIDSALLAAERFAQQRVKENYDGKLEVYGVGDARIRLAAQPGGEVHIVVRGEAESAYGCGRVHIMPMRVQRHLPQPAPADDGRDLVISSVLFSPAGTAREEPAVGWSARSGTALLLGMAADSPSGNAMRDADAMLEALQTIWGKAWEGAVYAADTVYEAGVWRDELFRRDGDRWHCVQPSDEFAARAKSEYEARGAYSASIQTSTLNNPAVQIAMNEQFLLVADADGASVSVATDPATLVHAARQATGSTAPIVLASTRLGTFVYDEAGDSFQPHRLGSMHAFVRETLAQLTG